jgi:hypothetical protein
MRLPEKAGVQLSKFLGRRPKRVASLEAKLPVRDECHNIPESSSKQFMKLHVYIVKGLENPAPEILQRRAPIRAYP